MTTSDTPPREAAYRDFLQSAGWSAARLEAFPGDASTRRYFRVSEPGRNAILMDAPAAVEAPACPPDAGPAERQALGYNAVARLAGNNIAAFAGLAEALTQRGFSAPRIHASAAAEGLLLIEDLGDDLFARLLPEKADEAELYGAAAETLGALYRSSFPAEFVSRAGRWLVQDYDSTALIAETGLFLDWYAARRAGVAVTSDMRAEWEGLWAEALPALDAHAPGLVLRDFHAENLLWLPDRKHEARTGLLDFQDALFGHPAYDLVSLIEDARRDVSADLAGPLKTRFLDAAGLSDRAGFDAAYALLAAQRNAKILGIFVRLAERDGKRRYLDLLGRVGAHFASDLAHPLMAPVRGFIARHVPQALAEAS